MKVLISEMFTNNAKQDIPDKSDILFRFLVSRVCSGVPANSRPWDTYILRVNNQVMAREILTLDTYLHHVLFIFTLLFFHIRYLHVKLIKKQKSLNSM
jgi:hypothetical protein